MVLRSVSSWAKNYDQGVRTVFGAEYDSEAMPGERAERLDNAEPV
jgi:hypothetical protein